MKQNETQTKCKTLLLVLASIFVATISVGITLAYLTAQTNTITNEFKAAGGLTGRVKEPAWNVSSAQPYIPNKAVAKDPLVQNTTKDTDVYVGVKVDFYVYPESANGVKGEKVKANYEDLVNFLTISDAAGTKVKKNSNSSEINTWTFNGDGTGDWEQMIASENQESLYFFYKTILKKVETPVDPTTTYGSNGDYSSQPLFTQVIPSKNIKIQDLTSGTGYSTTVTGTPTGTYKFYNFDIEVTGYAVKAFVAGTQADGLEEAKAKTALLYRLGGSDTDAS